MEKEMDRLYREIVETVKDRAGSVGEKINN